ncbi:MAG: VWA domain-containing protein, partial [Holophagales bacterium]|nr:VWA domain-containing protein [Holophagales bacterium]
LRPAGRKRTIESLRSFLATDTVPSERVLIVAQTPDLRTLAPFGSTYEALDSALARLDEMPAHGHEKDRDRQLLTSQLADIYKLAQSTPFLDPCEELANAGQRAVEAYSQRVKGRAATTLRHLAALSSGLAGVPGNKILFYVSDGLEVQPGVDFSHQLIEICPHRRRDFELLASRVDILDRFRQLTRHANANRVSFYTFDAMGHRAGSTVSAEASDFEWTPSSATDHVRVANLQSSLSYLASDTGGRAVFGQTDIRDELEEIAQDMSYFYSLAYNPDHRGDDRTHVIDVRVPGKRKARIRHRMTYRDKPAEERMADRLQTALTLGIEDNPLAASLAHGEIRELGGRDSYEVPLRVTVPLRGLVFLPQAGSHLGTLRLQVAARDADGRVAAFHQKRFEVELDPGLAGEAEGEHTFVVPLKMRGGEHVVAVGIRDETGRATSYLASRLVVQTTPVAAGGR